MTGPARVQRRADAGALDPAKWIGQAGLDEPCRGCRAR